MDEDQRGPAPERPRAPAGIFPRQRQAARRHARPRHLGADGVVSDLHAAQPRAAGDERMRSAGRSGRPRARPGRPTTSIARRGAVPSGYVPVATGLSGTTFLDTAVSGGVTYSYRVTTAESAGAASRLRRTVSRSASPRSVRAWRLPCSGGRPACRLLSGRLASSAWTGTRPRRRAAPLPVYNVYRSTSAGFEPDRVEPDRDVRRRKRLHRRRRARPGDRLLLRGSRGGRVGLRGRTGRGGNEEGNKIRKSSSPEGALVPVAFFDGAKALRS